MRGSIGVDVWSVRNQNVSPDGGATPAPRREGNRKAQHAAYRSGMVFRGKIDIPLIDWRNYLEPFLDMHNSHQSFASRQRMLDFDGDASNQVIWFTDAPSAGPMFDQTPMALDVIDEWMANIAANPSKGVGRNKPADAVDRCFDDGRLAARTRRRRLGRDPRRPADGRLRAGVPGLRDLAHRRRRADRGRDLRLHAPARAARGGEGAVRAVGADPRPRSTGCGQIFPDGVCDYTKGDLGRPPELKNGR